MLVFLEGVKGFMGIEGMEEKSGESERKQMMKMKGGEMGVWDMKREGYVKEVKTKNERVKEQGIVCSDKNLKQIT